VRCSRDDNCIACVDAAVDETEPDAAFEAATPDVVESVSDEDRECVGRSFVVVAVDVVVVGEGIIES